MTYKEAALFLKNAEKYGSVLGLDSMKRLLAGLGNPQDKLKFVHIAGTNGKGSTAAFISNILAVAGHCTGRYISPSVFGYLEKIQVCQADRKNKELSVRTQYIREEEIGGYIEKISRVCDNIVSENLPHPTVFEIETAMAMLHFVAKQCDIVVLEVGLGGRLDATNVITTTLCSVITAVSMDHMDVLGNTIEEIAAQKAGIIKPGVPVVSYEQDHKAIKVIEDVARLNNSTLIMADFKKITVKKYCYEATEFSYENYKDLKIKLLGENQVKNASVALLAANVLKEKGYFITDEHIKLGLLSTSWRGRFEIIKDRPLFLIDGAHNEDAAYALANNLKLYFKDRNIYFILGVLADKDYDGILRHTARFATAIYTITPNNKRGLDSGILAKEASKYNKEVTNAVTVANAISLVYQAAGKEDVIIAFGSLSYLKEIYQELGVAFHEKSYV